VAALQALAALGPDAWMVGPAAEAAVHSTDRRVRQAAAELLGKLSPVTADTANVLKQALSDPDLAVRKTASDALLTMLPAGQPNQATLTAAQSP
jgi:HEAT repeat protein